MPETAQKILVCWRDIPAQVVVKQGRKRGKAALSERFQQAIDRAAMRARKQDSDAYMDEWRRVTSSLEPAEDLQTLAEQAAQALEAAYPDERLLQLIRNHGRAGD